MRQQFLTNSKPRRFSTNPAKRNGTLQNLKGSLQALHEPFTKGASAGYTVSEEELAYLKDIYYQAKGWTKDGLIPSELLVKLGMPDVAEQIGVKGE